MLLRVCFYVCLCITQLLSKKDLQPFAYNMVSLGSGLRLSPNLSSLTHKAHLGTVTPQGNCLLCGPSIPGFFNFMAPLCQLMLSGLPRKVKKVLKSGVLAIKWPPTGNGISHLHTRFIGQIKSMATPNFKGLGNYIPPMCNTKESHLSPPLLVPPLSKVFWSLLFLNASPHPLSPLCLSVSPHPSLLPLCPPLS